MSSGRNRLTQTLASITYTTKIPASSSDDFDSGYRSCRMFTYLGCDSVSFGIDGFSLTPPFNFGKSASNILEMRVRFRSLPCAILAYMFY